MVGLASEKCAERAEVDNFKTANLVDIDLPDLTPAPCAIIILGRLNLI